MEKQKSGYRNFLFSRYVSSVVRPVFGETSLKEIERQFPVWEEYFGRFFPENSGVAILDLACGYGSFIFWLQRKGYQNTEGVDISDEQVNYARKLGIKGVTKGDARFFLGDKHERYDIIVARDFMEHLNKEEVIRVSSYILSALKPGGIFLMQVPNAENLMGARYRYGDFTHEVGFTSRSARQVLLASGFKYVSAYPQRPVIRGIKSFVRYLLWRVVELMLHFYLIIESGSSDAFFTQDIIVKADKSERKSEE